MSSREPASYARAVHDSLVEVLKAEGQEDMLTAVIHELVVMTRAGGAFSASVTSAVELSDVQRQTIERDLQQSHGNGLSVSYSVDPSLLGGLLIRVGDKVLDTSVRQRLNAIQRNMTTG